MQLSAPSAGPSTLDTSHRGADAGREDRHRRDTAATGRGGQTGVNYKVIENTGDCSTLPHVCGLFVALYRASK